MSPRRGVSGSGPIGHGFVAAAFSPTAHMSNIVAVLIVRLTHTGVYADGRPNTASVTIYDLDQDILKMNRARSVPVPAGGFVDIPMSSETLRSFNNGSIAGLTRQGLIDAEIILQLRDVDHFGGPAGTGQTLRPGVQNVERIGNALRLVIPNVNPPANVDSAGYLVGEEIAITGLTGAFVGLNGSYQIATTAIGAGLGGPDAGSYLVTVPSSGPDIPAAIHGAGVTLRLTAGRVTVQFSSDGNLSGFGANIFGYVAGQILPVTGAGGGGISVEDEGILIDPAATLLNFVGAGVTASSAGPGAVDITIPGGGAGQTLAQVLVTGNTTGGTNLIVSTADQIVGQTDLILTSPALFDVNAGANLDIDVTGTYDMLSTGTFSIDGTGPSNVSATSGNLTFSTITSGALIVNSAAALDIDAATTVDILAAGAFSIDGTGASNVTATTGGLTLSTATSGTLLLDAAALLDVNASANIDIDVTGTFDVLATGAFSIDGTGASNVTTTSGNLTLSTITSGVLIINSAGAVDVDAATTFDMLAAGTFSIDGTGASNVSATSGNLTLSTITSGNVLITGAAAVTLTAGNAAAAAGNAVTVTAGSGGGNNPGGAVTLTGGIGGTGGTSGVGGFVNLTGGAAGAASAANGGNIVFTTGAADGAGVDGFVDITGPNAETEALLRLTTTGTNGDSVQFFVGDSSPSGTVTGLAGSLFLRDTGTGGELWLNNSTGSGTTWLQMATGASVTLQAAYVGGNTITTSAGEGNVIFTGTEDFVFSGSDFLIDPTASFSIDSVAASNVSVTGADLTLSTITSGSLIATSAGLWDLNAGANLDIDITGTFDVLATGVFSIDGTGASNVSATSGNLTLSTITSGSILVDAVGGVEINATGGALSIGNDADAQAINLGTGAAARTVTIGNATGATTIDINTGTGGMTVDTTSGGAISLDAIGAASNFTVTSGNLTLSTLTTGQVILNGVQGIEVQSIVDFNNNDLDNVRIVTFNGEFDNGNSGSADTIDWNNGQKQLSTLTASVTYTFTAPAGPCNVVLRIAHNGTGGFPVTWPASVLWPGGTAVQPSTGASTVSIFSFYYNGTNYYGQGAQDFS